MNRRTNSISLNSPLPSPLATTSTDPIASTSTLPISTPSKRKRPSSSTPKRVKPSTSITGGDHEPPSTRLADLGGIEKVVESILELVALPISHPEVYLHTGVRPPRGVLLVGPPGCGKTMLAGAIAGVGRLLF